jgi:hypothetical protein
MPRRDRLTSGNDPIPKELDTVVWTDAEYFAPTGIRSPDRPARSELLQWLNYPGPRLLNGTY